MDICEVTCRSRRVSSVGLFDPPPRGSSEALCCPLLVAEPLPTHPDHAASQPARQSGRYGHMAAVYQHINRCVSDSSLSLSAPLPFVNFPSWHEANKVWLGLISPVADKHRSLAWPTGNYCSIIIDGNQR